MRRLLALFAPGFWLDLTVWLGLVCAPFIVMALVGCSPVVEISTPWGIGYRSTKDVSILVEVEHDPATGELVKARVQITSDATAVITAETERLRALSEGIAAGIVRGGIQGATP